MRNPTNINALKPENAQNELANGYQKEQAKNIRNQINKITDSFEGRRFRIAWQTIKEANLKATSQEQILHWKQHFENLLGNPPKVTHESITKIIDNQLDIKLGHLTQNELDSVQRKIKNRKAAMLDETPSEVWKAIEFDDILLRQYTAVYNQNTIDRYTEGCILPFSKKGDLGIAKNYRGINITSIAVKIYNAQLHNRIEPKTEKILRKNQNDVRRNRCTT